METIEYLLTRIDGDYALLQRIDRPAAEPLFIARALLPQEADEGSRIRYKAFEYTIAL